MPRLALRELCSHDVSEYYALVQRSARHLTRLGDYLEVVAASEDEVAVELFETSVPALRFGIRLDDVLVGRADLNPVAPPRYGLGYWLAQDATGRGVGTTAVAALITYARDTLAATDVFAGVTHHNTKRAPLTYPWVPESA